MDGSFVIINLDIDFEKRKLGLVVLLVSYILKDIYPTHDDISPNALRSFDDCIWSYKVDYEILLIMEHPLEISDNAIDGVSSDDEYIIEFINELYSKYNGNIWAYDATMTRFKLDLIVKKSKDHSAVKRGNIPYINDIKSPMKALCLVVDKALDVVADSDDGECCLNAIEDIFNDMITRIPENTFNTLKDVIFCLLKETICQGLILLDIYNRLERKKEQSLYEDKLVGT